MKGFEKFLKSNRKPTLRRDVVADFKAKTKELFHPIGDLEALEPEDIEDITADYVQEKLEEAGITATVVGIAITGSRCRGLEKESSDLDLVVELDTEEREDNLFDILHEDGLKIGEILVDINPITASKTGTLETYLPQVEEYLAELGQERE